MLLGRGHECSRIERLLDEARAGRSGTLVVRGEVGIGKTALLRHAVDRASGMTVVSATGLEAETELEFSGLLEVLRPLLDAVDEIPAHQASALRGALGLAAAEEHDRFAVGAATLSLVAGAAELRPLLVAVDDAQWLDAASLDAMRFAARRLDADRVAFLFAVREGEERPFERAGFEELGLGGLDREASRALLANAAGGDVAADVAARLHEATGGNPLALLELAALVGDEELAGRAPLEEPLPAGERVRHAFARRVDELPGETRRALLLASVSSVAELDRLALGLAGAGLSTHALEPAEDAGLVTLDGGRLRFGHPLVRAAVSGSASASERRAAHRALADAFREAGEPEHAAWHLAAATLAPDEQVAAELAAAGMRLRERGGPVGAAAVLERAARLTPDPDVRVERQAVAAEAAWEAGAADRATALLDEALDRAAEPLRRASLLHLRARIERQTGDEEQATRLALEAADLASGHDPVLEGRILFDAAYTTFHAGRIREAVEIARRAREAVPRDGSLVDGLVEAICARMLTHSGAAREALPAHERAVEVLLAPDEPSQRALTAASISLNLLERPAEAIAAGRRAVRTARQSGGPLYLAAALALETWMELRYGTWERAVASGTEGLALARDVSSAGYASYFLVDLAFVDAVRGDPASCAERLDEARGLAHAAGNPVQIAQSDAVLGLLELGQARPERAVEHLGRACAFVDEAGLYDRDTAPHADLVEALVLLGRDDEGHRVAAAATERAERSGSTLDRALAARARGTLAGDADFEPELREAVRLHDEIADALGRARAELLLGERLVRAERRGDGRSHLRTALDALEALGADPWAERARRELRAAGEKLRRKRAETGEELTPQELQIALQVAEGKTNKEVGAALFLSPKTVEFHLGRVYRKLGISSRAELATRYGAAVAAGA